MQQHTRSVGTREPLDERGGEGVKLEQCVQYMYCRLEMVIVTLLALAHVPSTNII